MKLEQLLISMVCIKRNVAIESKSHQQLKTAWLQQPTEFVVFCIEGMLHVC